MWLEGGFAPRRSWNPCLAATNPVPGIDNPYTQRTITGTGTSRDDTRRITDFVMAARTISPQLALAEGLPLDYSYQFIDETKFSMTDPTIASAIREKAAERYPDDLALREDYEGLLRATNAESIATTQELDKVDATYEAYKPIERGYIVSCSIPTGFELPEGYEDLAPNRYP